jgi:hypothetical protein
MKNRFVWASAAALALTVSSQVEVLAQTNGVILISTRKSQDLSINTTDALDQKGPGQASQGDVAMAELLGDNGYSSRIVLDTSLNTAQGGDPTPYLTPANPDFNADMVILSGSSGSADVPGMQSYGIPIMIGEHSCIGDRALPCSCLMYSNGTTSGNITDTTGASPVSDTNVPPNIIGTNNGIGGQYMLVLQPNHPIMQGIPLDALGRVKIMRDKYPEENAHVPPTGKPNYEYSWTAIPAANAAPGTTVIGILDTNTTFYADGNWDPDHPKSGTRAVFAVNDVGGMLSDGSSNTRRLVHWIVNEDGSGGSRRMFNALTDIGRVIFIRSVKWSLGQTLTPYQPLGLIRVSQVAPMRIKLAWDAIATKNYKILGTQNLSGPANFSNWQTVAQDIKGINGEVSATFDISGAQQYAFLRVMPVP